ncbi:MAG: ATP-binding protein [Candidatus Aminicenantes bacterium]|nr:MAG: ATP-binding protein [Candidatus Aminicenantes bacterium]
MNKSKKEFYPGKISFEIETLGPIRDSIVNFKPFLLFSGESNTGKSYTAMAVYYLFFMLNNGKKISELVRKFFDIKKNENDLKPKKEIELELPKRLTKELERLYNDNIGAFMAYMLGYEDFACNIKLKLKIPPISDAKIHIYITQPKGEEWRINAEIESGFPELNKLYIAEKVRLTANNIESICAFLLGDFCRMLVFRQMECSAFFLPPARGTFSGLAPSMWKEISSIGIYNEFLKGVDSVRYSNFDIDEALKEQKRFINPLFEKLLNGKITVERDRESYKLIGSDKEIPLTAGSSSVKELFPLYLLLNRVPIERLFICIEEPEAHLHPELQRSTALLLSYIVNQGGFIQVTTHSDFFVNQVNNLLKLHFIKNKEPNRFKKILKEVGIQEEFVLDPKDMGNYYFEKVKDVVHVRELKASENGMPLESFKHTYDQSVKETRNLREALTDDEK